MACFLVPAGEAVVTTIAAQIIKRKEAKNPQPAGEGVAHISLGRKVQWLSNLLWGGSALLAYEHLWHGEIVPFFPFLTAANDPAEMAIVLQEMSTVGVSMAALITVVWAGIAAFTATQEQKLRRLSKEAQ